VAQEKARGLKELYAADERTCSYFTLHTSADVHHTRVWKQQLGKRLEKNPQEAEQALAAAEKAAKALWHALDGIEMRRSMQVA
jgi:pyrroloquinoline-quinone synthase